MFDLTGALRAIMGWINGCIATIGNDPLLTASLEDAIPSAYSFIMVICRDVVAPIGWTILSAAIMIDMYQNLTKDGGFAKGINSIELVMVGLLKLMILKTFLDATPKLLGMFYETGMYISKGIAYYGGGSGGAGGLAIQTDQAVAGIGTDLGTQFACLAVLIIVVIVAFVTSYIAKGILLGRFIQLYLFIAFSPIPLAFLGSSELRHRGWNFIMSFFALSIQAAVIMLIMYMFPAVMGSAMTDYNWSADPMGGIALFTFYSVVLAVTVFASNRISSQILGQG